MCGRFEQSGTRRYYAHVVGADTGATRGTEGDLLTSYNVAPGLCPWIVMLNHSEPLSIGMTYWVKYTYAARPAFKFNLRRSHAENILSAAWNHVCASFCIVIRLTY